MKRLAATSVVATCPTGIETAVTSRSVEASHGEDWQRCDGPPNGWANHLASYCVDPPAYGGSLIGCAGTDCTTATCNLWVWLVP